MNFLIKEKLVFSETIKDWRSLYHCIACLGFPAHETFREFVRFFVKIKEAQNAKTKRNFEKKISEYAPCILNSFLDEFSPKISFFKLLVFREIFALFYSHFSRNRLKRNFVKKAKIRTELRIRLWTMDYAVLQFLGRAL